MVPATVTGEAADTAWGKVPVPPNSPQGAGRLLVRPAGVRLHPASDGLRCHVLARTFRGDRVTLLLRPEEGPRLEAGCALRDAPAEGDTVGVSFTADEVVVLAG